MDAPITAPSAPVSIVKTAGVDESIWKFTGKACVFESQEQAVDGILGNKVDWPRRSDQRVPLSSRRPTKHIPSDFLTGSRLFPRYSSTRTAATARASENDRLRGSCRAGEAKARAQTGRRVRPSARSSVMANRKKSPLRSARLRPVLARCTKVYMATLSSLQQKVINVLNDPAVKKIPSFQVGTNRISGATLQSVATDAIRTKGKQVTLDNTLPKNVAAYNSKKDTMRVSGDPEGSFDMKTMVVHECTHMVQDSSKMKMTVLESETMAYIVQCAFSLLKAPVGMAVTSPAGVFGTLLGRALDVAKKVLAGKAPSANDLSALQTAIKATGLYAKTAGNLMVTNG
jgi:hypothetical protein